MIAKRIFLALTLAAVAAISATALRAQSQELPANGEQEGAQQVCSNGNCGWLCQLKERQAQQLEGSWVHTPSPVLSPGTPPPPPIHTYLTFSRGGAVINPTCPFSEGHIILRRIRFSGITISFSSRRRREASAPADELWRLGAQCLRFFNASRRMEIFSGLSRKRAVASDCCASPDWSMARRL